MIGKFILQEYILLCKNLKENRIPVVIVSPRISESDLRIGYNNLHLGRDYYAIFGKRETERGEYLPEKIEEAVIRAINGQPNPEIISTSN